jgi:hypothetical protein
MQEAMKKLPPDVVVYGDGKPPPPVDFSKQVDAFCKAMGIKQEPEWPK